MSRDWIHVGLPPKPTMRQIAKYYAVAHGMTLEALQGPARHRAIFAVRAAAMLAIRSQTKHSLPKIGRFFNRDHTSVMNAIRRAEGATSKEAKRSRALAQREAA